MNNHDFISRSEALENLKVTMRANGLDPDNEAHWKVPIWDARLFDVLMDLTPDADVVPKDFHERCMEREVKKRIAAEKTARQCIENYEPVKHGHWESECEPNYKCSFCTHMFQLYQTVNYCPNCGARMDKLEVWDENAID